MRRKGQQGSSLPEVMVAAVILGLLLAPLAFFFGTTRQLAFSAGQRSKAVALARSYLERATTADPAAALEQPETPDPDFPEFTVEIQVRNGHSRANLREVTSIVRWRETAGRTGSVQLTVVLRERR